MAPFSLLPTTEVSDLADDVRAVFDELESTLKAEQRAHSGECHPALDVFETDDAVEIVMDIAGIPPEALRVLFRGGVVLIAGEKAHPVVRSAPIFHLVEREFGRFARAVRLSGAFDVEAGRATIRDGELMIVLPKRSDRRGRAHRIPLTTDSQQPA